LEQTNNPTKGFCSSSSKPSKLTKKQKIRKRKSYLTFLGITVAFSVHDKLVEPFGFPSGRVFSHEFFHVKYPQKSFKNKEISFGFFKT